MTPVKLETQHNDRQTLNTFGSGHNPVALNLRFVVDSGIWVPVTNIALVAWENLRHDAASPRRISMNSLGLRTYYNHADKIGTCRREVNPCGMENVLAVDEVWSQIERVRWHIVHNLTAQAENDPPNPKELK